MRCASLFIPNLRINLEIAVKVNYLRFLSSTHVSHVFMFHLTFHYPGLKLPISSLISRSGKYAVTFTLVPGSCRLTTRIRATTSREIRLGSLAPLPSISRWKPSISLPNSSRAVVNRSINHLMVSRSSVVNDFLVFLFWFCVHCQPFIFCPEHPPRSGGG